ncbi:conjugal transfer protein TrbB 1 (plasmid) [Rhizobium gallicum bv. gallicum R602sp]|uniref:Conjugal transfer protein TrbB 1 n=1 Tax=Rhizobium gallicum bv. gallicum R602sp TaxID=1041138 RepID=A0A0B4X9Y8_9HYPH|nr:conjugal transfer protein TrbB 1 [Rhizobium gallicum bv. gallicum R602sp]
MNQLRSHPRLVRKLQEALGDQLCVALDDSTVVEIMLNPDGKLFIERLGHGVAPAGEMSSAAAEMVIGTVAHALQSEVDTEQPIVSGELPIGGHRFEGLLPPVVSKPAFTIRRRASRLIPLEDYVRSGVMSKQQALTIRSAISSRLNIIISGGSGSGKTTLANAVINEIVKSAPDDRLVILEDTAEIQCTADNAVLLHTSDTVDMARLLKSTMRLRPDRIVVGEVRDGAALTLLKAWNTGHTGGVATIHSNTAMSALRRLEQLTAEASQQPMQEVIGEAVDLIISIERTARGRRVRDVIQIGQRDRSPIDRHAGADFDMLPGNGDDRLDERRDAAWARSGAEITTLSRRHHHRSLRRANEDKVSGSSRAIERHDTPEAEGFARCQVDAETADDCGSNTAANDGCHQGQEHDCMRPWSASRPKRKHGCLHLSESPWLFV